MSETQTEHDWVRRSCKPCEGGTMPLEEVRVLQGVKELQGWSYEEGHLARTYTFGNYYQTMAFVNAVAYIAHVEDHHPELTVGYKTCRVRYRTHAIDGISDNDFICAAKINRLVTT